MLKKLWTLLKRATVGEKLEDVGRTGSVWDATANVDIRRVSDGRLFVTLSLTSTTFAQLNNRVTTYAYLNDAAVEQLAANLVLAIKKKETLERSSG